MNTIHPQFGAHDGQHLSDTELFALHEGRLAPAQFASARQHLLACAKCLRAFKELSDFFTPPQADEPALSEEQIGAAWVELKPRLKPQPLFFSAIAAAFSALLVRPLPLALAASLCVVISWASLAVWRALRPAQPAPPQLAQASVTLSPQASPLASVPGTNESAYLAGGFYLTSGEKAAGNQAELHTVYVPVEFKAFRLRLGIDRPLRFNKYGVELFNLAGQPLRAAEGRLVEHNFIEASFARSGLPDGKYLLRLAASNTAAQFANTYEARLEISSRPK